MNDTVPSLHVRVLIGTVVLLAAAGLLISRANDLSMWFSEIFTFFHTAGTFEQVLDPDLAFPPGYYIAVYGWRQLVGGHDFAVSMFGVLSGMLTVAFVVRFGRRVHSWWAGWLAGFGFATSSYAVYFMLENRASGLQLTTMALAAWLYLRWLSKPVWRRAVLYMLACTLMMFVHYFGAIVLGLFGVHLLLTRWRLWWRWLLLGVGSVLLLLPLIPPVADLVNLFFGFRTGESQFTGYFAAPLSTFYQALSARWDVLFGAIVLGSVGGLVWLWLRAGAEERASVVWLAVWGVAVPLTAYLTREQLGMFLTRYLSFTLVGLYVLLGVGLAALPKRLRLVGGVLLVMLAFAPWQPFDHRPAYEDAAPLREYVVYMSEHLEPNDVFLVEPDYLRTLPRSLEWVYYQSVYAPFGQIRRTTPDDLSVRRIWYLEDRRYPNEALKAQLSRTHIITRRLEAANLVLFLYQGPPGPDVQVGERIVFKGADIAPVGLSPIRYRVAQDLTISLWWSVEASPEKDYSVSLRVVDSRTGEIIVQSDGPPQGDLTPPATSAWQPGELYRDDRHLKLPFKMEGAVIYHLEMVVYWWGDEEPLSFKMEDGTTSDSLRLERLKVITYNQG